VIRLQIPRPIVRGAEGILPLTELAGRLTCSAGRAAATLCAQGDMGSRWWSQLILRATIPWAQAATPSPHTASLLRRWRL